ncbi:F0F1 ATP synthase subunit B [Larkinella terrae]|uniref:ATP synthase subunit b n=1 Tax=Larkinella terrae TaxID=2025311 RepID=A0A7K0EUR1_9BACT|nr:F0F1 ATP synthase subunit B [Larkinella terrae]MRS65553.1 F0F1 ATP synthase subunit B [Larkinella terrae]
MDLLIPDIGLLFWMVLVFGLLYFILSKFAWKPITESLKEREDDIQKALDMAEKTRIEMAKLQSDNQKLLAEARAERDAILRGAKETADRVIAEARDKATEEGNRIIVKAREELQTERQAMVAEVKREVIELSLDIAEKVLKRELSDKKSQEELVKGLVAEARLN